MSTGRLFLSFLLCPLVFTFMLGLLLTMYFFNTIFFFISVLESMWNQEIACWEVVDEDIDKRFIWRNN